ncbi:MULTISPECIES: methyltransferase [Streptomyces]|uniref:Methyltransferase n=2 Tax=Streptomyces rimosus subsp. rimosus TaxID=132474 RepID=L8EGQ0_STRR1|nr:MULTISPECIES: methyltransferase [Streptomyces]KOG79754.1 methyltransferase [Kitasatospora aureofaciens]MYT45145.1 methyltransferase [Streptomyces sp. SID5471]KEF03149.1 methyltransferase [Streptomyces rimosus]KEF22411.1 methyltransferase [Streptomyces rimosus]KOT38367.1 methyltransferase [Streptomyces sp. NRRL WC-3701]
MADGEDRGIGSIADLVTPMAVRVAATLRVADHLAGGVRTARELAAVTGADAGVLERVLRHLVTVDVFSRDAQGRYGLLPRGEELRDGHPSGVRRRLDAETALGRGDLAFVALLHSVRTGEAAYPRHYGRSFWEDLRADPKRTADYDAEMGADATAWAEAVVPAFDWGTLGRIMDVGGGNGTLLAALLTAYPEMRGTVFDQPETVRAARAALAAAGLADRGDAVAGDFFGALPSGADGYVLSAILHDWDDDAARTILRRCAEAAGAHGRVLVVERVGADGESVHTGMDLRMLVYFGARERGVAELTELAAGAGLRVAGVHQAGDLAVVEMVAA